MGGRGLGFGTWDGVTQGSFFEVQYFPHGVERLVSAVHILGPNAVADPTRDAPETGGARVGSLTWRSHPAPVEGADNYL